MASTRIAINGLFLVALTLMFSSISDGYAEDVNVPLEVLWQQEIDCGDNTSCSPGIVTINRANNDLLIIGTSFRPSVNPMDYSGGKLWLWKINGKDATVSKSLLEDVPEHLKMHLDNATRFVKGLKLCADGNILAVGSFGGEKHSTMKTDMEGVRKYLKPIKASEDIVDSNNAAGKMGIDESVIVLKQVDLADGNLLLIGKNNRDDGLIIKLDTQGDTQWQKAFEIGPEQVDLFTDGVSVGSMGDFLVTGCSTNVRGKFPSEPSYVCLLLCAPEGNVMFKRVFQGICWPGRLPQLCKIGLGEDFILAYDRSQDINKAEYVIEAFTPELTSLWRKQIIKHEALRPLDVKIKSASQNNFVVGEYIGSGRVTISEYDIQGNKRGMSTIDNVLSNFSLDCTKDKAFVVLQTSPKEIDRSSKIKVVTLGLKDVR